MHKVCGGDIILIVTCRQKWSGRERPTDKKAFNTHKELELVWQTTGKANLGCWLWGSYNKTK